jgi:CHAD domain-containing protein
MDVLTEFAAPIRTKGDEECHVRLLEHLGARRQKQAGKLQAEVTQLGPGLRKELDQASSRMTKRLRQKDAGTADNAIANAVATAVRLSAQLATPPRLTRTNLHPYRLKVKELQNVLLIADTRSRHRFVEDLGEVKDAIGAWHDWTELVGIASKLLDHDGSCLLLAELKRVAAGKYDDALARTLKLRKTYIGKSSTKRKNAAIAGVPRPPVWEALARLAG